MKSETIVLPRRITFSDWLIERKKYNLRVVSASVDERLNLTCVIASENGKKIIIQEDADMARKQAKIPIEPSPNGGARAKSPLARLLAELVERAEKAPGKVQRIFLPGGLRVDTIVGLDGMSRVMLGRQGVAPSDTEWVTTLNHWPYDPPLETDAERFEHKGWHCMRAGWKTPEVDR